MKTLKLMLIVMVAFLVTCKQEQRQPETNLLSHEGPVRITGAYALSRLAGIWVREFSNVHPEYSIIVEPNGSNRGVLDILQGKADIAMVSSELPDTIDSILWIAPVARMAVVPIINPGNPYYREIMKKGINREQLVSLFSSASPPAWGDLYGKPGKDPVKTIIRDDSAGSTDIFARFLWLEPSALRGKGVSGDQNMIAAVQSDPLAIGYCNFIYAIDAETGNFTKDICVIPIDNNFNGLIEPKENFYDSVAKLQRAMWTGKFPCGLTRSLSFAAKGKPSTVEEVEFLRYVLTDGQKLIPRLGYIELHSSENKCRVFFLTHTGE